MSDAPLGLIAGGGRLPLLVAEGARRAGRQVVAVGLSGQYEPELPDLCDDFAKAGIIQLGRWMRRMRRWQASEVIMVGTVSKQKMYDPLKFIHHMPDWRALSLWYRKLRHDRRSQVMLTALADELKKGGVTLIDSTQYIPDHLASIGVMTKRQPTTREQADIDFAWPILMQMNQLDIGQAVAVKELDVIAVEAIEGTKRMIERAGQLCRAGGWVLVKGAGDDKDMRFDVPTIGLETIDSLKEAGATCMALKAGATIMLEKEKVIEAADLAGISIVGMTQG